MNGGQLAQLFDALRGIPDLPGAACTGQSALFDIADQIDAEPAIAICGRCPVLNRCREWARARPPNTLNGVVGCEIHVWVSHPSRRRAADAVNQFAERHHPARPKANSAQSTPAARPSLITGWAPNTGPDQHKCEATPKPPRQGAKPLVGGVYRKSK